MIRTVELVDHEQKVQLSPGKLNSLLQFHICEEMLALFVLESNEAVAVDPSEEKTTPTNKGTAGGALDANRITLVTVPIYSGALTPNTLNTTT